MVAPLWLDNNPRPILRPSQRPPALPPTLRPTFVSRKKNIVLDPCFLKSWTCLKKKRAPYSQDWGDRVPQIIIDDTFAYCHQTFVETFTMYRLTKKIPGFLTKTVLQKCLIIQQRSCTWSTLFNHVFRLWNYINVCIS